MLIFSVFFFLPKSKIFMPDLLLTACSMQQNFHKQLEMDLHLMHSDYFQLFPDLHAPKGPLRQKLNETKDFAFAVLNKDKQWMKGYVIHLKNHKIIFAITNN